MTWKQGTRKGLVNEGPDLGPVRRVRTFVGAALIGLTALAVSACGEGEAATTAAGYQPNGSTVVIRDLEFEPETLTVESGDTVTWRWDDGAIRHDVVGEGFRKDAISEGTFRHRFDEPGTYDYKCTLHPNMTGTIEVTQ